MHNEEEEEEEWEGANIIPGLNANKMRNGL
jgi:hypothetical protein